MRARSKTLCNGWLTLWAIAFTAAACAAGEKPTAVRLARFAMIFPEADAEVEEKPLSPGASWLLRPKTTARMPTATVAGKNRPATPKTKAAERVPPLRRDRPKRETDPPKTRRPQLGW